MIVKVCDTIMGAGKTESAITLMNQDKESRYVFITPYLDEVERIKRSCSGRKFKDPQSKGKGKLENLHYLLSMRDNIASTHALFESYNDETISLIQYGGYKLILDEVFQAVQTIPISPKDLQMLKREMIEVDSEYRVRWVNDDYEGRFEDLRDMCMTGNVILYNDCLLLWKFPIEVFQSFDEVIILTYMFDAQVQKYYFDIHNIEVQRIGTVCENGVYHFSDTPHIPDYVAELPKKIHIIEDEKLNKIGEMRSSLYRRMDFTFSKRGKEYCRRVINVTFKYSVKEFNRFFDNTYIKYGYLPQDVQLTDNICIKDGELIAVRVGSPVENPASPQELGDLFVFDNGMYRLGKTMKVLLTVAQLRNRLYQDGFTCDGIVFRRFKRSSGSSRIGKCLFIDEQLYPRMHKWELCGLKVKDGQEIDLAALEAYIALTLSSIVGTIPLRPENFLVIDDYKSVFKDRVVATRIGSDNWLTSKPEVVEIENSIWDGQSLIDKSAMGEWQDYGMILLRNRFFKSACFNTNIQKFFADRGITDVSQLSGFTLAQDISDIKVITTPSSIKYVKFGTLEQWLRLLDEDGNFGVVKHEKPTHFFDGRMVQIHYQLLNTLQLSQDDVDQLVKPSLDYLRMIQTDPAVLRYHIKYMGGNEEIDSDGITTTNDVVYQMLGVTDKFSQTKLYHNFKTDVSKSFKKELARGHILVEGNYSTLLGNPIEMLYSAIGQFDGESKIGVGNIFCQQFAFDQTILGSRSPHVTMGNVLLARNTDNEEIRQYVNTTREIVCINSIGENILFRLSGADFDSDTMLLTNNTILIRAAERNYHKFLVPTSMVDAKKIVRHYTKSDQSDLDIKTSVNKIGEIVNLSQELNTKLWDALNSGADFSEYEELYCEIAQLDVLSNIEIDKAKREYAVDSVAEIKRLRKKYEIRDDDGRQVKPNFFGKIARMKGYYDSVGKNYRFHNTTMDFLQHSLNSYRTSYAYTSFIPFSELLVNDAYLQKSVSYSQVERILGFVRDMRSKIRAVWDGTDENLDNYCGARQ